MASKIENTISLAISKEKIVKSMVFYGKY